MRLVPVERKTATKKWYKSGKNQKLIQAFLDSEVDCARVDGWAHKNAFTAANTLNRSAESMGAQGVHAISRGANVYLIRVDD